MFSEKQIFLSQLTEAKIVKIRQMLISNANLFQWTVAMNQDDPDGPPKNGWRSTRLFGALSRMRLTISRRSCGH